MCCDAPQGVNPVRGNVIQVFIQGATRPCYTAPTAHGVIVFLIQHNYVILTDERRADGTRKVTVDRPKETV